MTALLAVISYFFGFSVLVWLSREGIPVALPEVALVCLCPFALLNWRRHRIDIQAGHWLVWGALCWICFSCGGAASVSAGVMKAVQMGLYLLVAPLVIALLPEERERMLKGLAAGFVANLVVALVQGGMGLGGICGGLLVMRVGLGTGLAVASAVLFLRDGLPLSWVTAPWGNVVLMAYGAVLSGVSGIVLGGISVWSGYKSGFVIRERQLHIAPFLVAVLVVLLISPARRAALLDCVTPYEKTALSEESPRRWVQERICASRAFLAAPWFGYGPGKYQSTVGLAHFRGTFPRPNETKVELNTQDGWEVVAVEYGLVPALLLLVGLLCLWVAGLKRGKGGVHWAFLLMALGMLFTPLLVKGSGMLVALCLGLSLQAGGEEKPSRCAQWIWMLCAWLVALGVMLAINITGLLKVQDKAQAGSEQIKEGAFAQLVEAEALLNITTPFEIQDDEACSGGRLVIIPDRILEGQDALRQVRLTYALNMTEPKTLHLWMRVRWQDGCGNSVFMSWDGGTPVLAGNDGTYQAWHWVYAGDFNATAGTHELALLPSEDGVEFDQLVLCEDAQFRPVGIFGREALKRDARKVEKLPLPETIASEKPAMFGIAGPYRGGFEGVLIKYGLPVMRLMDYELEDVERLSACSVIMISEPMDLDFQKMTQALTKFVEDGGVLVLEKCDNWMGAMPKSELYPVRRWFHARPGGTVIADDSWIFAGITPGTEISLASDVALQMVFPEKNSNWQGHGSRRFGNRTVQGLVWERDFGKGHIIYSAIPLSFQTMWRDRNFEQVLRNIVCKLASDAGHASLWSGWKAKHLSPTEPCFMDDFMRVGDEPGSGWIVKHGKFACAGEQSGVQSGEFTLECKEAGELVVGDETWKDYRFACSVHGQGTLGLKFKTSAGRDLALTLNDANNELTFKAVAEAHVPVRVEGQEPGGWHRVSVLCRDAACEVFVDGRQCMKAVLLDDETLSGSVGVSLDAAGMLLDDVSVRAVADILAGCDRAAGEEGSCLSLERLLDPGIEPYTVFTPFLMFRPGRETSNGVDIPLPLSGEATLWAAGKAYALPETGKLPTFGIPQLEGENELMVETSCWKDYVFKSRMTDWYGVGGNWTSLQRWSCDRNWSWLGVEADGQAVLWHRQTLEAPYAMRAWISMGARDTFGSEYERGRDLNLVFAGNGKTVADGWTVRVMRANNGGVQLWHGDQMVAQRQDFGMGSGHTLHHSWYEVSVVVEKDNIHVYYEGREVINHPVEEQTFKGQVGVWTENNSIRLGRVMISGSFK